MNFNRTQSSLHINVLTSTQLVKHGYNVRQMTSYDILDQGVSYPVELFLICIQLSVSQWWRLVSS